MKKIEYEMMFANVDHMLMSGWEDRPNAELRRELNGGTRYGISKIDAIYKTYDCNSGYWGVTEFWDRWTRFINRMKDMKREELRHVSKRK